ncbi:MAG: acetyl-CoA carboxylase biotin carboxyl carrier protein [Opitutaceae bacterium]|nr:acetyl-CoA carboxylase biotin carboxyl carrier protein [Opitutaceae bacterium]
MAEVSPPAHHSRTFNRNPGLRLDIKQIKMVIDLMKRSDLTDFEVEEEGFKLRIRRNSGQPTVLAQPLPPSVATPQLAAPASAPAAVAPLPAGEEPGIIFIKSPMVGTFYRTASPESAPFADVGSLVTETSVVCIIEAMKIMNEIQAEVKGAVVEVLVESGQPVEYGQRLFKVKQS